VVGPLANTLSANALGAALESISPARMTTTATLTQSTSTLVNGISSARLSSLRNAGEFDGSSKGFLGDFRAKAFSSPFGYLALVTGKPSAKKLTDFKMTQTSLSLNAAEDIQPLMMMHGQKTGLWIYGFGNQESLASTATDTGFKTKTGGYTLGLDHSFGKNLIVGLGLGRAVSLVHLNEDSGNNRIDNSFINVYGSYIYRHAYLDAAITTGRVRYNTDQIISFSTLNRMASGQHRGFQFTPHLGIGYQLKLPLAQLTPFANLDYSQVYERGYTTIGANSLNQTISSSRSALLRTEAGIKLEKSRRFCHCQFKGSVTPSFNLSWVHKQVLKQGSLNASFVGQPGSFSVDGYNTNSSYIAPGLGLAFNYDNGGFISTHIHSEMGHGYRNYEANLKVGLVF